MGKDNDAMLTSAAKPPAAPKLRMEPLQDRLLVRRHAAPKVTAGGVLLPDIAKEARPQYGTVLASGPGRLLDNGVLRPNDLKAGDRIAWLKQAGVDLPDPQTGRDNEFLLVCERDVIGKLVDA